MTPARAALQLHAFLASLEEHKVPILGARILKDGRWYVKVGEHLIVTLWLDLDTCPHPVTNDRHGVRIWSRP